MHGNIMEFKNMQHVAGFDWCVVAVRSGHEFNVQREIADYPTYLPLETRLVVIRGRKLKKVRPLIYGYIFAQVTDGNWGKLEVGSLKNSLGVLKNNDKPSLVRAAAIEKFMIAEEAGIFDYTGKSPFKTGDSVEITEGPLAGLIGRVRLATPRKRARLLLGALGEADIDMVHLRKVG